jgi:hypothetical protein
MTITFSPQVPEHPLRNGFHIITFAETGYAMLNIYGEEAKIDRGTLEEFASRINRNDSFSSLHPVAPISAVPRRLIRDGGDAVALYRELTLFLRQNGRTIKAKKLLFDFRAGVAPFVLNAVFQALQSEYVGNVDDVVAINANEFDGANPRTDLDDFCRKFVETKFARPQGRCEQSTNGGQTKVICIVSKEHLDTIWPFFFTFRKEQVVSLKESRDSYVVVGLKSSDNILRIPGDTFEKVLDQIGERQAGGIWDIHIRIENSRYVLRLKNGRTPLDLTKYHL